MPKWLSSALFYEIYPQSFYDSNGDGIGDLNGIRQKLDYIQSLGCNALWLNPCFESPFQDAGYDVSDYRKIAPRYGTNGDMKALINDVHARGMHILLDLVPGHTSIEHPWFKASAQSAKGPLAGRYIWTNSAQEADDPDLSAETREKLADYPDAGRAGKYYFNYYDIQPALNYGFAHPTKSWQSATDSPEALATLEELKNIMRFWLDMGADGFRVDMAHSLVKNDGAGHEETQKLWRNVRAMLDAEYPDAAIVSEWFNPAQSLACGFHADFYLQGNLGYMALAMTGEDAFFHPAGDGSCSGFAEEYTEYLKTADRYPGSYVSTPTGNHDVLRMSYGRSERQIKLMHAFDMTLPGLPVIYYGDEIGMKYLELESKEGGLYRTGSRTPMQWDSTKNAGFSTADDPAALYLPIDPDENRPTVEKEEADPESILNNMRRLIRLRRSAPALGNDGKFEIIHAEFCEYPLVYKRYDETSRYYIVVNPSAKPCTVSFDTCYALKEPVYAIGDAMTVTRDGNTNTISVTPESFAIFTE